MKCFVLMVMLWTLLSCCALADDAPKMTDDKKLAQATQGAFVTTGQVHQSVPAMDIRVSDTGVRDETRARGNLLKVSIQAQDGSLSQELTYWSNETPDYEGAAALVCMQDMNFDGYPDLTLLTAMGARNVFYTAALWDTEAGRFREVMEQPAWHTKEKTFSGEAEQLELCNYELYPQERRVFSSVQDGYRYSTEVVYEWEGKYGLAPKSVADIYDAGEGMIGELLEMHGTQILRLWDEAYPEEWYYGQDAHTERLTSIRALTLEDALYYPMPMEVDNVDWVNLRKQDSIDSPSLAKLSKGTTVYLLDKSCGSDGGWMRVLVLPGEAGVTPSGEHEDGDGLTGYIWRSYLKYLQDSVSLPGAR